MAIVATAGLTLSILPSLSLTLDTDKISEFYLTSPKFPETQVSLIHNFVT